MYVRPRTEIEIESKLQVQIPNESPGKEDILSEKVLIQISISDMKHQGTEKFLPLQL